MPVRNCSVGDRNCMNPKVVSGNRLAASAKHNSGSTVTGPAIISHIVVELLPLANASCEDEYR